mmetsp:Transcript_3266/g.13138  ORF Transcript_3266/g.13138 Transcript_3266/m.13138 type:complete len:250 (-) Transcript_3266:574-1323(-)
MTSETYPPRRAPRSPTAPPTWAPPCARAQRRASCASRMAATEGTSALCSARTARPWRPWRRSGTGTRARFPKAGRRSPPRPRRTTTGSRSRGSRRTSRTAPGRSRGCGTCATRTKPRRGSWRATTTRARASPCLAAGRTTTTRPRTREDQGATPGVRTTRTRTRTRPTVRKGSAPRRMSPLPAWRSSRRRSSPWRSARCDFWRGSRVCFSLFSYPRDSQNSVSKATSLSRSPGSRPAKCTAASLGRPAA